MNDIPNSPAAPAPNDRPDVIDRVQVAPETTLAVLSQNEVTALCQNHSPALRELLRRCVLAVLSSGIANDDAEGLFARFPDFEVDLVQQDRGVLLDLKSAPALSFVGDHMIRGVREHLFAVLRDLIYITPALDAEQHLSFAGSDGVTDVVFRILRNAGILDATLSHGLTVCWGGHAISRDEYDYTKQVGYELGLRGLDVCTGCGPGAMKGPMKGATIAHAKQRVDSGRYIGITEPGIIAAEAPNPIVNALIIMPDIEKRLEAFVRLAHGIIIFPGGVGTAEELLYLLGVLAHPDNAEQGLTVVLTGPPGSADYFAALDEFVRMTLGPASADRYRIVIDDPARVAELLSTGSASSIKRRQAAGEAVYFNWQLVIEQGYQNPFVATHAAMAELQISDELPSHELAANLRRAFSGIVAGNVKESGVRAVASHGPFQIHGQGRLIRALDNLLRQFVAQGRMRLGDRDYQPCYEIVQ